MVKKSDVRPGANIKTRIKFILSGILAVCLRRIAPVLEALERLYAHASLSAALDTPLATSTVILGKVFVHGTGNIQLGEDGLLYPDVHLETHGSAEIEIGDGVVISRGTHIVAMSGIAIGEGSMIGEYTSIRDANHTRQSHLSIRDAGYTAKPIIIGREVWLGRGVTVLGGVTIGNKATVGANAVVTKDVAAGTIVAGVPAVPIPQDRLVQGRKEYAT